MKKLKPIQFFLSILFISGFAAGIYYLMLSFCFATFDIKKFDPTVKGGVCFLYIMSIVAITAAMYEIFYKDEKQTNNDAN